MRGKYGGWTCRVSDKVVFLVRHSYDIIKVLPPQSGNRKGVYHLELLLSFYVAVMAGVACHYIIKWLDGDDNDN